MGARTTLNGFYFGVAFFIAALVGLATQSWPAFFVTGIALLGVYLHAGRIRSKPRRRRDH
jgi:hypothetical protein